VKTVPEDYVVVKFFQYVGAPEKNKYNNTYQGSCPMCREGSSWLRKRRFYYLPKLNRVFCHNCGYNKSPLSWIMEISCCSLTQILSELNETSSELKLEEDKRQEIKVETLPKDCINLFDESQLQYYKHNKIVKLALTFMRGRLLDTAVNRPEALFLSLDDRIHKNRLILPFYDDNNKIVYYQSRTILEADMMCKPKYLSKFNSEKTIFNINKINSELDTIYIFEGPINSCFIKNGVAVGGIQENSYQMFTCKQKEQIDKFPFHKKIWILDSQWKDKAAFNKTKKLLELKENVFIWPKKLGEKYKDFNDIAIAIKCNQISPEYIKDNCSKK